MCIFNEVWKPIKGYEGLYDISNYGRVYSYPRRYCNGGYSYGSNNGNGYLHFTLSCNGKECSKRMHILVWESFVGSIPKGYDVDHKNHNKHNNFVYVNEDGSVDLEKSNLELIEKYKHRLMHLNDGIKNMEKPVLQYTLDDEFITEYKSVSEASKKKQE